MDIKLDRSAIPNNSIRGNESLLRKFMRSNAGEIDSSSIEPTNDELLFFVRSSFFFPFSNNKRKERRKERKKLGTNFFLFLISNGSADPILIINLRSSQKVTFQDLLSY